MVKKYLFGYVRVSSKKQKLERQVENIKKAYGDGVILFSEKFTGTKVEGRKEFNRLVKQAIKRKEEGAEVLIIFDSVSRMSRNAQEGVEVYFKLFNLGIELVFLKEPHINTVEYRRALGSVIDIDINSLLKNADEVDRNNNFFISFVSETIEATNKLIIGMATRNIILAFEQAEKEVCDIQQRTKEGLRIKKEMENIVPGPKKGAVYNIKDKDDKKQKIKHYSRSFGGTLKDAEVMTLCGLSHGTYYKYKKELYKELAIEVEAV